MFAFIQFIFLLLFSFGLSAEIKGKIICRYYKVNPQMRHGHIFKSSLPWIYAKEDDKKIHAKGMLEDGFFIPEKIYRNIKSPHGKSVKIYDNSLAVLKTICEEALKKAFPKDYNERSLLDIYFKKPRLLSKKIPIVFASRSLVTPKIDRAILFGDSLSDQGRIKKLLRIYPPEPYFSGRFSDGPIWPDYFTKLSGISIQNWAIGGSVSHKFLDFTFDQKNKFMEALNLKAGYKICGSLKREVTHYKKTSLKGEKLKNANATLFIIWIGGNDYLNPLNSRLDADIFIDQPEDNRIGSTVVITNVITNISRNMEQLYKLGARHFLVINLADMGVMPKISRIRHYHRETKETKNEKMVRLSKAMTAITRQHNLLLSQAVKNFKESHKDVAITEMDTFNQISPFLKPSPEMKESPFFKAALDHDFVKTVNAKDQSVMINKACYYGDVWPSRKAKRCNDASRLWFWDEVHPSSFTHCLFSYFIHARLFDSQMAGQPLLKDYLTICKPEVANMSFL